MKINKESIFLVCTGLGKVSRGFEQYMGALAEKLNHELPLPLVLFTGGSYKKKGLLAVQVPCISNTSFLSKKILKAHYGYVLEQLSFFLFFLPYVIVKKPRLIYLGEYRQYCYLFRARQYLGLSFSLALYTGGQVYPGLFDDTRDYVHHITPVYLEEMRKKQHDPHRQFLVPHFIRTDFDYDEKYTRLIRSKASGKKIVLSVGLVDKRVKRMDFLVNNLAAFRDDIFPVILGQFGPETSAIKNQLENTFGDGNYILDCVPFNQLGNYYKTADLFILCSLKESFGLVLLEALYHDVPVICHDFEESRYVMRDYGWFVDMNNGRQLQDFLTDWFKDNIGHQRGYRYVQHHFSWEYLRLEYINMFKKAAGYVSENAA